MIELLLYLFAGLVVGCIFLIITYKTHDCVTGEDLLAFLVLVPFWWLGVGVAIVVYLKEFFSPERIIFRKKQK